MEFINQAVTVLQTLVVALGAGLAVWGVVNLMEGYGNDNPGANYAGILMLLISHECLQKRWVSHRPITKKACLKWNGDLNKCLWRYADLS